MIKFIITEKDIDNISYTLFDYLVENPDGHAFEKLRLVVKDCVYENIEPIEELRI